MKNYTLLILAAGLGSRFGGLKQIEGVGPNNEFIIDYSIYDAIQAGFTKVVFVIKEENYEIFKETIGKRIEDKIKVEYAFQNIKDIPEGIVLPEERIKPLGTGQAVLAARNCISEDFAIISADDFYGRDAFVKLMDFYKNNSNGDNYVTIGYRVENTLSKNGSVKRGLYAAVDGKVDKIYESVVEDKGDYLYATPLMDKKPFVIDDSISASMLMFGLRIGTFTLLEKYFREYLEANKDKLDTFEYLLPEVLESMIKNKECEIFVSKTDSKWYGVTYPEDLQEVKDAIRKYIEEGVYPTNLWDN